MNKHTSESSPHDKPSGTSESSIVVAQVGSYKLTQADREQLQRLAARPDSEIDFSDIPRFTAEELAEAERLNRERKLKLKKAS